MGDEDLIARESRAVSRRRRIVRTELVSGVGCALLGVAFRAGGHTLQEMSLFLFGWAAGCAVHLTQTLILGILAQRRERS
jgi:hypothetical protein